LPRGAAVALLVLAPATAEAAPAWIDKLELSGYLQSDIRFDIDNSRGPVPGQGYTFSLNRNDFDLKLKFTPHPDVIAVVEPRVRYYGFVSSQTLAVADLWNASDVSPFTLYMDQAYVAVKGVPSKWIDLKAGRMQVTWAPSTYSAPTTTSALAICPIPSTTRARSPTRWWRSMRIPPRASR